MAHGSDEGVAQKLAALIDYVVDLLHSVAEDVDLFDSSGGSHGSLNSREYILEKHTHA